VSENPARVAVVGAGLAGLRAATTLAARGCRVIVLEARPEAGGKAAGETFEGFSVDRTIQLLSFDDRRLLGWIGELALGERLLPLRAVTTAQLHGREIVRTSGRSLLDIARTPGVRARDALRLLRLPRLMRRYAPLLDPEHPERAADLDYRSLADFARLYLGRSVLERFVAPLATSATLGNELELSRVAWLLLWQAGREGQALPGIAGAGLHEVVRAAQELVDVRTDVRVEQLKELPQGGLEVDCATSAGEQQLCVEAVVLATSPREAHRVAAGVVTPAERDFFGGVRTAPRVTLSVGVDHTMVGLPQYVRVPHVENSPIESMLVEPGAPSGRAPEGNGLVTVSANTAVNGAAFAQATDDALTARLLEELDRVLPRAGRNLRFAKLHRDPEGAPRFEVGAYRALARFQRVQEDRRRLGRRLYYAGDYLAGPRLEDAVASGVRAAQDVFSDLGEQQVD